MHRLCVYGLLIGLLGCKSTASESEIMVLRAEVLPSAGEGVGGDLGTGSCQAPAFIEGKFYTLGTQVVHQGRLYTAVHENNAGYDPAAWGWFWTAQHQCEAQP
ncbi:MAG: hypothetical protein EOP10_11515 [Proteobacteria bacterium]|nr:MAG: hypothetical protein EOP10_11515 [Pseudomonadota bacterium]